MWIKSVHAEMELPTSHLADFAWRTGHRRQWDGNVQSIPDVQNIAHAHISRNMVNAATGTAFLTNSLAFCLLSRVLSRGSGFNMEETWTLDGKVRASNDRRLEVPEHGSQAGINRKKDEIFVGGCGCSRGYRRQRSGAAKQHIQG